MKKLLILVFLAWGTCALGQVAINTDGSLPHSSAMMDINATDRGILFPRLSDSQRDAIPSPAQGLLIFNNSTNQFNFFNGTIWMIISSAPVSDTTGSIRPGGGVSLNVNNDTPPDSSSILDISNESRGVLFPRIRPGLIAAPPVGMIVYNSSSNNLNYFDGTAWAELSFIPTGQLGAAGSQSIAGYAIKTDASEPHQSALLDVSSPNKGVLIPRLTSVQRNEILPVNGLTIYNLTSKAIEYYNGASWHRLIVSYLCGLPLVDIRDGQSYNTVQIGYQCWMAESINVGLMAANNTQMANNGIIEKYCYDNDEMDCQEWGALYQWDEAMQYSTTESSQGICPYTWHIPSEAEWVVLDDYLGGYNSSGGPMKQAGTSHWASPNTGATNASGFTGIGSGYNDYTSPTPSHNKATHNYIWSSTTYNTTYARRRLLLYFNAKSNPYYDLKWIGFSVRCVKD